MDASHKSIGKMLDDDEYRSKNAKFLNKNSFNDEDIKKIVSCLKEDEFSFEKLYNMHGKNLTVKAMGLANESQRREFKKRKRLAAV